jgi:hypothetical protein
VATKYVPVMVKLGDENDATTDVSLGSYKKYLWEERNWYLLDKRSHFIIW